MASPAPHRKPATMTKREVIDYLGKSKRTVETYLALGRLRVSYVNGANGKQAQFDREDVERFKREMDEPTVRAVQMPTALASRKDAGTQNVFANALAYYLQTHIPAGVPEPKPWLPLAEAAEYSGLPASYLVAQARLGKCRAINVGTGRKEFWRFHRASLAK
jgi:hypothetical protein